MDDSELNSNEQSVLETVEMCAYVHRENVTEASFFKYFYHSNV